MGEDAFAEGGLKLLGGSGGVPASPEVNDRLSDGNGAEKDGEESKLLPGEPACGEESGQVWRERFSDEDVIDGNFRRGRGDELEKRGEGERPE